ncbi:hypothetical protein GUITHDRAFT_112293 [Guillardia theta CCMP2712]|uniref:Uncharacterized protein n=1 Tax=Guillardia theta (strain CCMP2712) TaxID=905079 RepID=L1IZR1_GUITC|nr:hypothetical protein GUITHDRAFT_112293 [Guillardia theta CCMP2712]EKX41582.1 hypothetical protein GUITHDRAFT_112293 [Guillardia theta CCMP2712]|eukprot:XP_005828562.1 hypothetical protein GUITHDRAFT_112293 [Guillardia theta CCMP2712]
MVQHRRTGLLSSYPALCINRNLLRGGGESEGSGEEWKARSKRKSRSGDTELGKKKKKKKIARDEISEKAAKRRKKEEDEDEEEEEEENDGEKDKMAEKKNRKKGKKEDKVRVKGAGEKLSIRDGTSMSNTRSKGGDEDESMATEEVEPSSSEAWHPSSEVVPLQTKGGEHGGRADEEGAEESIVNRWFDLSSPQLMEKKLMRRNVDAIDRRFKHELACCFVRRTWRTSRSQSCLKKSTEAAHRNESTAQYYLGMFFLQGYGADANNATAAAWLARSAKLGNPCGIFTMGRCWMEGIGVRKNESKALECFRRSADMGWLDAIDIYAKALYNGLGRNESNPKEAARYFMTAAKNGVIDAWFHLGCMFFDGWTVAIVVGFKSYVPCREAARLGHVDSSVNVGIFYREGYKVKQNDKKAFSWFRRAALNGSPMGAKLAGLMCQEGSGVSRANKHRAAKYFEIAAKGGDSDSQYTMAEYLCENETAREVRRDYILDLLTDSSSQGHRDAFFRLAEELRRGDANDCKKANDIIVEAADAGDADAMFVKFKWLLEEYLDSNSAEKIHLYDSCEWLLRASRQNHSLAPHLLLFLTQGDGGPSFLSEVELDNKKLADELREFTSSFARKQAKSSSAGNFNFSHLTPGMFMSLPNKLKRAEETEGKKSPMLAEDLMRKATKYRGIDAGTQSPLEMLIRMKNLHMSFKTISAVLGHKVLTQSEILKRSEQLLREGKPPPTVWLGTPVKVGNELSDYLSEINEEVQRRYLSFGRR